MGPSVPVRPAPLGASGTVRRQPGNPAVGDNVSGHTSTMSPRKQVTVLGRKYKMPLPGVGDPRKDSGTRRGSQCLWGQRRARIPRHPPNYYSQDWPKPQRHQDPFRGIPVCGVLPGRAWGGKTRTLLPVGARPGPASPVAALAGQARRVQRGDPDSPVVKGVQGKHCEGHPPQLCPGHGL